MTMRRGIWCQDCRTWIRRDTGMSELEQRRRHTLRCLGDMEQHPDLIELDATLERIAGLYVQPS